MTRIDITFIKLHLNKLIEFLEGCTVIKDFDDSSDLHFLRYKLRTVTNSAKKSKIVVSEELDLLINDLTKLDCPEISYLYRIRKVISGDSYLLDDPNFDDHYKSTEGLRDLFNSWMNNIILWFNGKQIEH